jgi:plasmid stabilization system protein ParE
MSIEPENLSALADEIERMAETNEQLNLFVALLANLEGEEVWRCEAQLFADAFQAIADHAERGESCDFLQDLRAALGRKYARRIGRE